MASYSVTFEDGSSHAYDNVPDTVTQDEVNQRAQQDFPDRKVAGIQTTAAVTPEHESGVGAKVGGALQTAWNNTIQPVGHFVMQHPIESAAIGSYVPGANRIPILKDLANARQALYDKYIGQQQTVNALKTPAPTGATPEAGPSIWQRGAQAVRQGVQTAGQGIQSAGEAIAPYARAALPYAKTVGFAGLMSHSPELNTGEDEMVRRIHAQQDQQMKINSAIRDKAAQMALNSGPQGPVAPGQ